MTLSDFDITPGLDGYRLFYRDGEVFEFPTFEGAAQARRAAITALYLLAKTLNERRA